MKKDLVLYIHGKGGNAAESGHYQPLFPDCEVVGLDYQTFTPWETGKEIREAAEKLKGEYKSITLIANSIGAFFSMNAGMEALIQKAYFISPIVDMERLICDMMTWANVTEEELKARRVIPTSFGEELSWDYLCYVREHPVQWSVPTKILYGRNDHLTSYDTIAAFVKKHHASLSVMENGEHWFHTAEQMRFLDEWIEADRCRKETPNIEVNSLTPEVFLELYTSVGWEPPCLEQVTTALKNSTATFTALEREKAVGMVRLIGDGGMSFYLKDFAVLPTYQSKGVGALLLRSAEKYIRDNIAPDWAVSLELISTKEALLFYKKMGFEERPCEWDGPGMFKMIR